MSDSRHPSVSVVVPVWNAAGDVPALLESLAGLDWPADRLERIVVDNGSTDGTERIVGEYPYTLLRETAVRSSYAARNRGVAAAGGEWIAFTDADCVVSPDWLRQLLLPGVPEKVGAVAGEVEALELETPVQRLTERYGIMKHAVTMHHKELACFSTANVAIRAGLLESLGGFREDVRYFGDMELSWRMQLRQDRTIAYRPGATIRHRHRRSMRELWRQGLQHGRGVAFMRRTYPDHYRFGVGEQFGRLGQWFHSAAGAVTGGTAAGGSRDRLHAPVFLALWYSGLLFGYLLGPARSIRSDPDGKPHPE